jgi:Rieske Fe-S protein
MNLPVEPAPVQSVPLKPVHSEPTAVDDPHPSGLNRRRVLQTAGLVALAGGGVAVLAACAPDSSGTAAEPSTAPTTTAPSAETSSSSSPSTKPTTTKTSTSVPSGPSVASSDVPIGGGVILQNADYVITQPTKNDFKCFSSICTHMGCTVARVADQQIQCDCHQSKFSITDGSVISGQATKPLPEYDVTVAGGKVIVDA